MASFAALYGRRCRSPLYWSDIGERTLGPDLLQEAEEKDILIRRRLETAQSRQRNYAILGDESWSFRLETVSSRKSSRLEGFGDSECVGSSTHDLFDPLRCWSELDRSSKELRYPHVWLVRTTSSMCLL